MRIYLAARYSRHEQMQSVAHRVILMGHQVVSRWIWGNHQVEDNGLDPLDHPASARFAQEDFSDLVSCDLCVSFTEGERVASRGGRHVEFGVALGLCKRVWIVGLRENVFHTLEEVKVFPGLDAMLQQLARETPVLNRQQQGLLDSIMHHLSL